jgi:hypothetical protein
MNALRWRDAAHVLQVLFEESTYLRARKVVASDVHGEGRGDRAGVQSALVSVA